MNSYSSDPQRYNQIWNKYRPALLKLMIDTAGSPQQYSLSDHEFKNVHPNEKGGHAFTLRIFESRAINNINSSTVAKNLLTILQKSGKATELSKSSIYEFTMDRGFKLNINRENAIKITDGDPGNSLPSPFKTEPLGEGRFQDIWED